MINNFFYLYQHLPSKIDPIAFAFGPIFLTWYSLMYLVGFCVVYGLLVYRLRKENNSQFAFIDRNLLIDFLFYVFLALLIGARIGYVIFYNPSFFAAHPLAIISPFNAVGQLVGIYGMSYHGGLIGIISAAYWFCLRRKISFWRLSEFVAPAIPAGYFFGRLGNFINGELYGRATTSIFGMYFPSDSLGLLRHPSQLYEAFLEGIVLFIILWIIRDKPIFQGKLLGVYLVGYASARFLAEFLRQPDSQLGLFWNFLTLGQIFSLLMFLVGLSFFRNQAKLS